MSSSRFLYLLPVILATACYLATDESWARSTASHSCFFHDGKTLCGEEAELARNEVAEDLKRTMLEQQRKADHGELPQGDDPRFESRASRVAFTGRANTNEKGNARPEKGQARPAPTPCPVPTTTTTTTTTTKPPCPLATTTPKPLTPCEKYRLEQEALRSQAYPMHDQPRSDYPEYQSFMADQPMVADQPQLMAVQEEDPIVTPPQASFDYSRGDSESLNDHANAMMESALPLGIRRQANQPRLSLYHTYMDSSRSYQPPAQSVVSSAASDASSSVDYDGDFY